MVNRSHEFFAASMARKIQALRQTLCVTLEARFQRKGVHGGAGFDSELVLRPMDERLAEIRLRWRDEFENFAEWHNEILDLAASRLESAAQDAGELSALTSVFTKVTVEVVARHCGVFLKEFEELAGYIGRTLVEVSESAPSQYSTSLHELPRPSGIPSPDVSPLQDIDIPMPGPLARLTTHGRERHFRAELADKAGDALQKVLVELRPRLQHWLSTTFAALEDAYHSQTDPMRYRNPGQDSVLSAEDRHELQNDILFLRGQMTAGQVRTGACE